MSVKDSKHKLMVVLYFSVFFFSQSNDDTADLEILFFSFRNEMGITMGKAVFHKELRKYEEPKGVLADALGKVPNLDLLVSVLPGKTPFYGILFFVCLLFLSYKLILISTSKYIINC